MAAFSSFERQAYKRFEVLSAAASLSDSRGLPRNRLEALTGDRAGQHRIRIKEQWRICFEWPQDAAGSSNVEIGDYQVTERASMTRRAIHPGEILADELSEFGVSPTELARQIKVPANRISQIINGKRAVTGDTALRLGHWFRISAEFWLNLQAAYDLRVAERAAEPEINTLPVRPEQTSGLRRPGLS